MPDSYPPRPPAEYLATHPYIALQWRISDANTPEELDVIWEDAKCVLGPRDPNLGGIAEAISRVRRILELES